jgi:hypothetical protein
MNGDLVRKVGKFRSLFRGTIREFIRSDKENTSMTAGTVAEVTQHIHDGRYRG